MKNKKLKIYTIIFAILWTIFCAIGVSGNFSHYQLKDWIFIIPFVTIPYIVIVRLLYKKPVNNSFCIINKSRKSDILLSIIMYFFLFTFPPIGILIMWIEKKNFTIKKKIIITSTAMIWFFFLLFNSHNNIKPENSLATNNEQQSTEMSQGNSLEELDNNNINETATNYLETETQQTETQQEDITDKNEENPSEETESHISVTKSANISTYVLNTSTKKFHKKSCSAVKRMKKSNYSEYSGTYDDVISMGYSACKTCKPR